MKKRRRTRGELNGQTNSLLEIPVRETVPVLPGHELRLFPVGHPMRTVIQIRGTGRYEKRGLYLSNSCQYRLLDDRENGDKVLLVIPRVGLRV